MDVSMPNCLNTLAMNGSIRPLNQIEGSTFFGNFNETAQYNT